MLPANTWCYDLEIIKAILDKGKTPEPGIEYCKGWGDHAGMGVSVLVATKLDKSETRVYTYFGNEIPDRPTLPIGHFLTLIAESDLLVGYNSRGFDAKVLAAKGLHIPASKHLDVYHEIKLGLRDNFPKGYRLDNQSPRCGGPRKTDDGAFAPHEWQRGNKTKVHDYCVNDVLMTVAVAQFYSDHGGAQPHANGVTLIKCRTPAEIAKDV